MKIRRLPATPGKQALAIQLANLVTEGDPGQETPQEASTTLADALREATKHSTINIGSQRAMEIQVELKQA